MLWTCPTWVLGTHLSLNWWVTTPAPGRHVSGHLRNPVLTGNTHLPRVIKTSRFLLFLQTPQRNGTGRARGDSAGMATLSTSSGAVTEDRSKPSIKSTRQKDTEQVIYKMLKARNRVLFWVPRAQLIRAAQGLSVTSLCFHYKRADGFLQRSSKLSCSSCLLENTT